MKTIRKICIVLFAAIMIETVIAEDHNFSLIGEKYLSPFPSPYYIEFVDDITLKLYWESGNSSDGSWDSSIMYNYKWVHKFGIPYISLSGEIPTSIEQGLYSDTSQRFYGNDFLFLIGQVPNLETKFISGRQYFPKVAVGYTKSEDPYGSHVFLRDIPNFESTTRIYRNPSSTLTEYGIEYTVDNLDDLESDTPWVEGVDGNGIGESFVIENQWNETYKTLFIINGFISADRPHLYTQNGRIKKIKIEGLTSGISGDCVVLDTPHPQTVDISFIVAPEDLKVTLLEVYEGAKYQDTAIHYLISYNKEIIPYCNDYNYDIETQ